MRHQQPPTEKRLSLSQAPIAPESLHVTTKRRGGEAAPFLIHARMPSRHTHRHNPYCAEAAL